MSQDNNRYAALIEALVNDGYYEMDLEIDESNDGVITPDGSLYRTFTDGERLAYTQGLLPFMVNALPYDLVSNYTGIPEVFFADASLSYEDLKKVFYATSKSVDGFIEYITNNGFPYAEIISDGTEYQLSDGTFAYKI